MSNIELLCGRESLERRLTQWYIHISVLPRPFRRAGYSVFNVCPHVRKMHRSNTIRLERIHMGAIPHMVSFTHAYVSSLIL